MTKQVASAAPRLVGSFVTLAAAVSWPQIADSEESIGQINVSVSVVDQCEVSIGDDLSAIDQFCFGPTDAGDVTVSSAAEAIPGSLAAESIVIAVDESDVDVQLITISY
jgi:hypothetical protein